MKFDFNVSLNGKQLAVVTAMVVTTKVLLNVMSKKAHKDNKISK